MMHNELTPYEENLALTHQTIQVLEGILYDALNSTPDDGPDRQKNLNLWAIIYSTKLAFESVNPDYELQ